MRVPTYSLADLAYGPASPDIMISPRVAPPMIGLGLLEAVPEEQILANADPDDANKDGIRGKPNLVWSREHDRLMLGRFGWKAGVPTIAQQAAEAFDGDIGLSTTMIPKGSGDCTEKEKACLDAPSGNSPRYQNAEVGDDLFSWSTFYSQNLAVPARRKPDDPEVLKGKALFYQIGCASCHKPKFMTGDAPGQPHLSHQLIWPYTDMLLHDMGEGLADDRPEGAATGNEWRTAPLWGIGLTEIVNGHTLFLHDGRARNLTEAILWHGGEAEAARDKFAALSKADRDAPGRLRELAVRKTHKTSHLICRGAVALRRRSAPAQRRGGPRGDRQASLNEAIRPGYAALAENTGALDGKVAALCKQPSAAALKDAKGAFAGVVDAWSKVEIFRFGPIVADHRYERLFYLARSQEPRPAPD